MNEKDRDRINFILLEIIHDIRDGYTPEELITEIEMYVEEINNYPEGNKNENRSKN